MLMKIAESMLSKRPALRTAVAFFSSSRTSNSLDAFCHGALISAFYNFLCIRSTGLASELFEFFDNRSSSYSVFKSVFSLR